MLCALGAITYNYYSYHSRHNMATTIAVAQETRELLRRLGEKGESYDRIINRLITDAGWSELDNRWNAILAEDEFIPLEEL